MEGTVPGETPLGGRGLTPNTQEPSPPKHIARPQGIPHPPGVPLHLISRTPGERHAVKSLSVLSALPVLCFLGNTLSDELNWPADRLGERPRLSDTLLRGPGSEPQRSIPPLHLCLRVQHGGKSQH